MAVRSEGQFLGEMAMFATAAVRCASVRAKGPVRVKIVPGEELMDLSPEVHFNVPNNVYICCPANFQLLQAVLAARSGGDCPTLIPLGPLCYVLSAPAVEGFLSSCYFVGNCALLISRALLLTSTQTSVLDVWSQARQQVQEMVWMKQSENMVLEAMTRLSTVHDALEELLMGAMMRPQTADTNTPL